MVHGKDTPHFERKGCDSTWQAFEIGGEFSASDGRLSCWKSRHGVHYLSVCSVKLSANPGEADEL